MQTSSKNKKGFTLIELLLVTGMISVLSSVIFFNITEAKKKGRDASMKADAQQISSAIALYKNDHNGFAPLKTSGGGDSTNIGITHNENDPNSDYIPTMQALVDGGYLSEIPYSPTGAGYMYAVSEDQIDAVFGVKLNNSIANNTKKYCSASPSKSYTFGSCDHDWSCPAIGQQTETSSCFNARQAPENCNCATLTSLNPSEFPSDACRIAAEIGFCTGSASIQNPDILTQRILSNQTAIGFGFFRPIPTGSILCQHNAVPLNSPTPLCDGSSNSDFCACI